MAKRKRASVKKKIASTQMAISQSIFDEYKASIEQRLSIASVEKETAEIRSNVKGLTYGLTINIVAIAVVTSLAVCVCTYVLDRQFTLIDDAHKKLDGLITDVEGANDELKLSRRELETARSELKNEKHDLQRMGVINELETELNGLVAVDILSSVRYRVARRYLSEKAFELENIEHAIASEEKHSGTYATFLDAMVEFSTKDPGDIDNKLLTETLSKLDSIKDDSYKTPNYYYFLAAIHAKRNEIESARSALVKAREKAVGFTSYTNARILNGQVILDFMDYCDDDEISNTEFNSLSRKLETLLLEYPRFWPARLNYSEIEIKRGNHEQAIRQLVHALHGGGANILDIIEMIDYDIQFRADSNFRMLHSFFDTEEDDQLIDKLRMRLVSKLRELQNKQTET